MIYTALKNYERALYFFEVVSKSTKSHFLPYISWFFQGGIMVYIRSVLSRICFLIWVEGYYRPQRSCGKVMFLHVSVILFTGRGGSLSGRPPRTETTPGQRPPRQRPPPDRDPPPRTVTSGWYASYWNAFLYFILFLVASRLIYTRN